MRTASTCDAPSRSEPTKHVCADIRTGHVGGGGGALRGSPLRVAQHALHGQAVEARIFGERLARQFAQGVVCLLKIMRLVHTPTSGQH